MYEGSSTSILSKGDSKMNLITKLSYERGILPDRYWYQLNDKSAQANYNEQILMRHDDEEEIVIRSEVSVK